MRLNNRGNWSLIGLLVAVAIVVIVAAMYFSKGSGTTVSNDSKLLDSKSKKQTVVGRSMDTAKATECRSNLGQIRTGIQTHKAQAATEDNPPMLKDIGLGVSSSFYKCPVSGEDYKYDPATGSVTCPTHTNY